MVLLRPLPYSLVEFGEGRFLFGGDKIQSLGLVNCYCDFLGGHLCT